MWVANGACSDSTISTETRRLPVSGRPCPSRRPWPAAARSDPVVDEVERRRSALHPRIALFVGHDIDRGLVEVLGPVGLAFFEHALAHDVGAGSRQRMFEEDALGAVLLSSRLTEVLPEHIHWWMVGPLSPSGLPGPRLSPAMNPSS